MRSLIKNNVAEKDIRDWLTKNGWFGRSAKFEELELYAIKRPGWEQLFRFTITVNSENVKNATKYGYLFDDERYKKQEIELFPSVEELQTRLSFAAKEMIVKPKSRQDSGSVVKQGLVLCLILVLLFLIINILT